MKEVGANCFLYEAYTGESILIDCGVHPEYDFDPHEIWERFIILKDKNVKAIVLTHVHQDHAGAAIIIANMLKVPIFTSRFGYLFLMSWQKAASTEDFEEMVLPEINIFEHGSSFEIGPFAINVFELAHSIPESFCFLIKVGGKTALHCGDFKLTGYRKDSFDKNIELINTLAKERVDLVVNDIINIKHSGITPPEEPVVDNVIDIICQNPNGKHFVFMFSTNMRRMINLWMNLHKRGVNVSFRGTSVHRTAHILSEAAGNDLKKTFHLPSARTNVFICTGSQGEPNSFMDRLANGKSHPPVAGGDHVYVSSTIIPQEKKVFQANKARLRRLLQNLHVKGASIFVHSNQARILDIREFATETLLHVSGHEARGGIKLFWKILQPAMILPYHAPVQHIEIAKHVAKELETETEHSPLILEPSNNETFII
ncbi:MBL fold metallo-hydrolase [Patescibacteria group bacterium]|nr:MBL fold metallo-hydrolase [Patescibacteria group bacterium]